MSWEHVGAIVSVRMYSHTIYFYIRTSENLGNVGSSRHKLPRHLQFCVGNKDPSGQNWSDTSCRRRHVTTCWWHFHLSDQGDDSLIGFSGGRFVITNESVHCPHLPGFVRSDVESCHGCIGEIPPPRNSSRTHLPLEDVIHDLSSSNQSCDPVDDSLDSFSGFSDPGGRFAITTESVHCPHLPSFVRSDVKSCHGFLHFCP